MERANTPLLVASSPDLRMSLEAEKRGHWSVGRDPSCELVLDDEGISRFHATVFSMDGVFHLIDHSLNGTLLFEDEDELRRSVFLDLPAAPAAARRAPGRDTVELKPLQLLTPPPKEEMKGIDIHQSLAELRLLQKQKRVQQMIGYRKHRLADVEAMKPVLEIVYSSDDGETLTSMGTRLSPGNVVVFTGRARHVFRFVD